MDHVVFLNKKSNSLGKILSGEKRAEARYSAGRRIPYNRVALGDQLYFKAAGEKIRASAPVIRVLFADALTPDSMAKILAEHNSVMCLGDSELAAACKKRCLSIIFFGEICEIPGFDIDKSLFGAMDDWISVEEIQKIRIDG